MDWCAERGMVRIPDDVEDAEASFVEPLNTCLKGVRLAGIQEGDTVLVIGQGAIGLLFTQLVKLAGATVITTDKFPSRRALSCRFGASASLDPSENNLADAIGAVSDGRGADLAIVAVPRTDVISQAFAVVRPAGKILRFAQTRLDDWMQVDAGAVCMQEKALIGAYSSDITLQDECAELIFSRRVGVRPLISHRLPLEQIGEAISLAANPTETSLKIVVEP